jgi:hypothetical protein
VFLLGLDDAYPNPQPRGSLERKLAARAAALVMMPWRRVLAAAYTNLPMCWLPVQRQSTLRRFVVDPLPEIAKNRYRLRGAGRPQSYFS